jgi:hypothetical protein
MDGRKKAASGRLIGRRRNKGIENDLLLLNSHFTLEWREMPSQAGLTEKAITRTAWLGMYLQLGVRFKGRARKSFCPLEPARSERRH